MCNTTEYTSKSKATMPGVFPYPKKSFLGSKRKRRWVSSPSFVKPSSPMSTRSASCSYLRICFVLILVALVYMNVIHLNSRYLQEMYSQGEYATLQTPGIDDGSRVSAYDAFFEQPTNQKPLPPIYWVNLDVSVDRRQAMKEMFQRLGITNTHRVSAKDVNQTLALWERGDRLIFHPNIKMEARDGLPSNKKHIENTYEYQEAACLLSHLNAILRAYEDGHEQVLILEDDALLSHNFLRQWSPYVERAPMDWKIIQFATNNMNVVKQGVNLLDFFVSWQPYHWSTRAYIINRAGMETLLHKTHSYSSESKSESIWRIDQDPMVVADEVIYYVVGDVFTSTRLWVDSLSFGSTIQSTNAHSNLTTVIGSASDNNMMTSMLQRKAAIPLEGTYTDTLLVLMNLRISNLEEMETELRWIRQDNQAVCEMHQVCKWEVRAVFTNSALLSSFQTRVTDLPKNIHFHPKITSKAFNKFAYLRDFVDEMYEFDLVLFKDNDQRISGFPWRTFVQRKGKSIIAAPLRQSPDEALLHRHSAEKRQWFQFHAAESWTEDWNTDWSSAFYSGIIPMDVPLLEMYFVLMDGKFASRFFDMILSDDFCNQTSAWGPDIMWCAAAREWNPDQPSCLLVPVTSRHEDTRQITKNTTRHKESGFSMVEKFQQNEEFTRWMVASNYWKELIGGKQLNQIERICRKILKLQNRHPFDLPLCLNKMYEFADTSGNSKALTTGSPFDVPEIDLRIESQGTQLLPWLQTLIGQKHLGGIPNKTRVAELVKNVKNSLNTTRTSGSTNPNRVHYVEAARQRTSFTTFQSRLNDLKARTDRAESQKEQAMDDSPKEVGLSTLKVQDGRDDAEE